MLIRQRLKKMRKLQQSRYSHIEYYRLFPNNSDNYSDTKWLGK